MPATLSGKCENLHVKFKGGQEKSGRQKVAERVREKLWDFSCQIFFGIFPAVADLDG